MEGLFYGLLGVILGVFALSASFWCLLVGAQFDIGFFQPLGSGLNRSFYY